MDWYPGTIEQAIKYVRETDSLLCVLIKDNKDNSKKMLQSLSAVSDVFSNCTCIQLTFDTPTCKQFIVYYPVLVVPSLYLINGSGVCLEVVTDHTDSEKIKTIVNSIKQSKGASPARSIPTPQVNSATGTTSTGTVEPPVTPQSIQEKIKRSQMLAGQSSSDVPVIAASQAPTTSAAAPLEQKIDRARELLEKKRREEEAAEREKEKQKEKERREVGKAVINQRKQIQEESTKRHAEEIRREKLTQKADMEAIREKIARDKAERKGEVYSGSVTAPADTTTVEEGKARIQIKFPATNTTLLRTFDQEDTLQVVVDYAKEELKKENFTFWNTYPRKQYKADDLQCTLKSLNLSGKVSLLGMSGKGYGAQTPASQNAEVAGPSSASGPPSSASATRASPAKSRNLAETRIQFKLTDGTSMLHIFDKNTTLLEVIKHFQSQCSGLEECVLWSLYPRYEITTEHVNKTLEELSMCPSAVIFVMSPAGSSSNRNNQVASGGSDVLWSILLTVLKLPITVLEYIKSFLFPVPRPRPPPLVAHNDPTPTNVPAYRRREETRGEEGQLRKRTKVDGNVTRLQGGTEGEEDDTNTYNGNSTQLQ